MQAAAIAVRQDRNADAPAIDASSLDVRELRIEEVKREGEDRWTVRLVLGEVRANVTVHRHHGGPALASCSGKTKPTVRYELGVENNTNTES